MPHKAGRLREESEIIVLVFIWPKAYCHRTPGAPTAQTELEFKRSDHYGRMCRLMHCDHLSWTMTGGRWMSQQLETSRYYQEPSAQELLAGEKAAAPSKNTLRIAGTFLSLVFWFGIFGGGACMACYAAHMANRTTTGDGTVLASRCAWRLFARIWSVSTLINRPNAALADRAGDQADSTGLCMC